MGNVRKLLQKIIQVRRTIFCFGNLLTFHLRNSVPSYKFCKSGRYKSRQDNTIHKRQLESASAAYGSSILLSNKNVHRRDNGVSRGKETKEATKFGSKITTEEEWGTVMPTKTLSANSYIYFSFGFPTISWLTRSIIKFYVESEFPISTYVVDEIGFQNFQAGKQFSSYGGFVNATEHRQEVRVIHEGIWYLIVSNPNYQNTAIHYEVS